MTAIQDERGHRQRPSSKRRGLGCIDGVHELTSCLLSMGHQECRPPHEGIMGDKERVVNELQKDELIGVDLLDGQARDLGPGLVGVVAVLKIFGGNHQGSQESSAAAVNDPVGLTRRRLGIGRA